MHIVLQQKVPELYNIMSEAVNCCSVIKNESYTQVMAEQQYHQGLTLTFNYSGFTKVSLKQYQQRSL